MIFTKAFPARPSSVPDIRDFLHRCLSDSSLTEVEDRELGKTILRALLVAAGPDGMIQVSCRLYSHCVEFDVLHSFTGHFYSASEQPDAPTPPPPASAEATSSFAEWMTDALRRKGLSREVAAGQLGVSVKTVSRWVSGQTEPRLRELRRIQEQFGDMQFR